LRTEANSEAPIGIRALFAAADRQRRSQLALVLLLTLVGACAELLTIGAVVPLIVIASNLSQADRIPLLGRLLQHIELGLELAPIVAAALLLAAGAIAATMLRVALNWATNLFVYGFHQDLVLAIFGRALEQPYEWHARQHSSTMLAAVEKAYLVTVGIVSPLINAATSAVMALIIATFLFIINPVAALIAMTVVGAIYATMTLTTRKVTHRISIAEANIRSVRIKTLQDALGGIRDIILDKTHDLFLGRMARLEHDYRGMLIQVNLIGTSPRLVVEGAVIVLVAALALWFDSRPGGVIQALPVLGALALGAQRLLPMVQLVYFGYANFSLHRNSLNDVVELLNLPDGSDAASSRTARPMPFRERLELRGVSFRYVGARSALSDTSLVIRRGQRIGIIGKTGSGKSTLVDILMGLLRATQGQMLIDDKPLQPADMANWMAQIAHVPQTIFLMDDSIAANIAFGLPEADVDHDRVEEAARKAGLGEFILRLPNGLATLVGERGVGLSGGQRQRIGIARALYKRASLLVLDEATSALDEDTEAAVMNAVEGLGDDITVVMIAHRMSTLANCDVIFRLSNGTVVEQGPYDQFLNRNPRDH
jgi:ABC-type multidrug transport system fused ATPase/permease subunit